MITNVGDGIREPRQRGAGAEEAPQNKQSDAYTKSCFCRFLHSKFLPKITVLNNLLLALENHKQYGYQNERRAARDERPYRQPFVAGVGLFDRYLFDFEFPVYVADSALNSLPIVTGTSS